MAVRRKAGVGVLGACLLLLSGCSAASQTNERRPTTAAQASQVLLGCMEESGWDVEISPDGGVAAEYPTEQADRYMADFEDCIVRYGLDQEPPALSTQQYESLYASTLEAKKCLAQLGYETSEPPSLSTFIESRAQWSPFVDLPSMDSNTFADVVESCPQPIID